MPGKNNNHLVTAKEIARKYKLGYPTINYYTDLGLLEIVRKDGNKRLYSGRQVKDRLNRISKMVNEGYPLRLICRKMNSR